MVNPPKTNEELLKELEVLKLESAYLKTRYEQDITERKRVGEALQRSEADLKEAQRIGRLGNWDWDTTTNTIIWSEEYYHVFGFDPTQPPPGYEEYLKLYTPESAAWLDAAVKESIHHDLER